MRHDDKPGVGAIRDDLQGGDMAKEWAKKFYDSGAWRAVRREVLRRDHYTCVHCDRRASEVHHVIELTPDNIYDAAIALNPANLLSLCHDCHTKITKGNTGDLGDGFIFDDFGQVIRSPHALNG
jgi:5-methylcytosine-specific restriction endonuclease McrA